MKKLLFLFALSLCSIAARAYDFSAVAPTGQTLYYTIIGSSGVEVTYPGMISPYTLEGHYDGYTKPSGNMEIPSVVASTTLGAYMVISIGEGAFYDCSDLTSVTIPNSVTSIGYQAFYGCRGLTSITIPNSVYNIGDRTFIGCTSLTSLTIPNSVTSIGSGTFMGCTHLTSVVIPNSVISIGTAAFSRCYRLTNVTIPNSVTSIGSSAFISCSGLTSVAIPNSVTSIGESAFYGCSGLTSVTIPNSVTSIGMSAFYNCSGLTSVAIPNSVTSIGEGAFYGCSGLTSISIPNSVTSIGSSAFARCSSLTSVTIPNSVISIGSSAFSNCSGLTSVAIPNSVTSIGESAFYGCSALTSVTIGNSVTSIGRSAFSKCSGLTSVVIPNSVTSIGSEAFRYCSNLKTVYNLSNLSITKGSTSNGWVADNANRVVNCTEHSGSGDNIIYKIPTTFTIVDNDASTSSTQIPRSTIPTNFIYKEGSVWKAKNIVLTDGQDAFEAPETFTAETATYTREFTNSNRSTLYLPFTAAVPSGLEVYDFADFANNTISFTEHTGDIAAYTPYLVGYDLSKDGSTTTCTVTKNNAVFPKSVSTNYHPVTHDDMTFSGVISRTQMTSTNNYGYSNGFFVQSGGSAHVNPFRCYFTYTPSSNAPQSLPPTLNVEVGYGDPLDIDAVETLEQEYDGRYGKDVYDMLGRLVRKNADNLEGLPKGVYIWKGKKIMNYDL